MELLTLIHLNLKNYQKLGEKAAFEKDGRMIMSVDTMLRLQNALKKVVDEMADKGIIVPKDKKKN